MDNTAPHISQELEIFFNEHNKTCTNCGKKFQKDMVANVGYLVKKSQQFFVMNVLICLPKLLYGIV